MAWSMPNVGGQWNAGINMMPDMNNTGSYTPEQWALMQQQNWQQWAQWQQQYSQWQSQYGDKYTQQMQTIQAMAFQTPTTAAPPPAPPPPEKPPPPPPHENDQPLYGKSKPNVASIPTSVQPPAQTKNSTQTGYNSAAETGKTQSWSYATDSHSETHSVNTEALKNLAEEERLFDIQFKKWEEEIQKWKRENVNHPDRQAYNEYEQKFESCRDQLLERRNQMKQKRDRLMGNTSQAVDSANMGNASQAMNSTSMGNTSQAMNSTNMGNTSQTMKSNNMGNTSAAIPPLLQNNYYSQNVQPNTLQNNITLQSYKNTTGMQYPPIQAQFNMNQHPTPAHSRINNKFIDHQDRTDSYQNTNEDYTAKQQLVNSNFLTTHQPKGIPGLDLVPEVGPVASKNQEVIDITEENQLVQHPMISQAPDYSKISKGINNILGDAKIMNILSMMSHQNPGNNELQNVSGNNKHDGQQWVRNNSNNYNNDYNNPQMSYKQQSINNYSKVQEEVAKTNYSDSYENYSQDKGYRQNNVQQEQFYDRQNQYGNQKLSRLHVLPPRPLMPDVQKQKTEYTQIQIGFQGKALLEKPETQPVKSKWVDVPLFEPSIIVDYEHKPLRLKARDFIEPVHMFDYNHKSKDDDGGAKKDFEREVDELFMRKSRRTDIDEDWNNERHYEKRLLRDDARDRSKPDFSKNVQNREGNDFYNRRDYDRCEERRRDDRDRFGREERRDRGSDYDRPRDRDYERDKDLGRDREPLIFRDRDMGRDRDLGRDKDLGRDRDLVKDRDLGRDRDMGRDRGLGRDFDRDRDTGKDREIAYGLGRDRISGRDRDSGRDKESGRERYRDRRDDTRNRSHSRDKDSRKRERSKDNDSLDSFNIKKSREMKEDTKSTQPGTLQHVVMIDDLLEHPGRDIRPAKIVIILRGASGSGKSYLAKLIRDREAEFNGTVRIMSIDDYFMHESEIEERDPATGKTVKKQLLKYEYDESLEESYINSLKRAFKRSITDGYFTFLIYDAPNEQLKSYADIWNFSRQNGFQVYICTMEMDVQTCFKRNIHNRTLEEIEVIVTRFFPTPAHHIQLDATTLLQSASIPEVHMEEIDDVTMEDAENTEVESSFTSKWEKMDDAVQLARLDGTNKPLRPSQLSMEDYLQLDEWTPNKAKPGKKTVRWADIEERREQEKMRAIGFVVGQTDWNRMTDPTMGSSALTRTKYIERVRKY